MLKLNYDPDKQAVTMKCSTCGGPVTVHLSRTLSPGLLARVLRVANEKLTDATLVCPACSKGK